MGLRGPAARGLPARFWEKVEKQPDSGPDACDGCWIWTAGLSGGVEEVGLIRQDSVTVKAAHRTAWFLTYGSWPKGALWRCRRNKHCVRPEHSSEKVPPDVRKRQQGSMSRLYLSAKPKQSRVETIRALMARKKGA